MESPILQYGSNVWGTNVAWAELLRLDFLDCATPCILSIAAMPTLNKYDLRRF
jgi:hypothetical protein